MSRHEGINRRAQQCPGCAWAWPDLVARSSTIVALYLLASAATAYAECAWVLWVVRDEGGLTFRLAPM